MVKEGRVVTQLYKICTMCNCTKYVQCKSNYIDKGRMRGNSMVQWMYNAKAIKLVKGGRVGSAQISSAIHMVKGSKIYCKVVIA